jgi:hypothetical protein
MTTILHRRFILAAECKGDDRDLHFDKRFLTEPRVLKYLMRHFVFGALKQGNSKPYTNRLSRSFSITIWASRDGI